jgi:DNA-binding winged helix-turn-helix (wHTH) protein/tetratricopeptide (TPR) repeat protein
LAVFAVFVVPKTAKTYVAMFKAGGGDKVVEDFRIGSWTVQPGLNTISGAGRSVRVEPKVMQVLLSLARSPGEVLHRKTLIQTVWEGTYVTEDVLTRSISELRKIFADHVRAPRYIQTIPKSGYRLIAPVRRPSNGAAAGRAIAVLPFSCAGGDERAAYLGEGVAEFLMNRLSELPDLKVLSRSVFRLNGHNLNPQSIGRELGVDAVLVGNVRFDGERLIIHCELVETGKGYRLWGEMYDGTLEEILTMQEQAARAIAARLLTHVSGADHKRLSRRSTENSEAYQAYLKGRYFWNRRTEPALWKAIEYFDLASRLDPNFAAAFTGIADGYAVLTCQDEQAALPPDEAFAKASAAVSHALELDDSLAEAHTSLAHIHHMHDWDWRAAEREFLRAMELNPKYSVAHHWRGMLLASLDRMDEAIAEMALAQDLDPLSPMINADAGRILVYSGRYDEAILQFHKALELAPDFVPAHAGLALAHEKLGRMKRAVSAWNAAARLSRSQSLPVACLGHICASAATPIRARRWVKTLLDLSARRYVPPCALAAAYARLGEADEAFAWIDRAVAERSNWLVYLKVDPLFESLRHDPRFVKITRRIGLP